MSSVTRQANVDQDSWLFNDGSTNYGNGKGTIMSAGAASTSGLSGTHRMLMRVPRGTLFDGVPSAASITAFDWLVRLHDTCVGIGGTVRLLFERCTADGGENSCTTVCGLNTAGGVGVSRYPGPATDGLTNAGTYSGSPVDGAWIRANCLALGQWWYNNPSVTALWVMVKGANAGVTAEDEATTSRRITAYTAQTSSVPYVEMTFNNNLAPYAPSSLTPAASTLIPSTGGTQAVIGFTHVDPEGDSATKYQVQAFASSVTDATADSNTPYYDSGSVTATIAQNGVRSHTITGLPARTQFGWRVRTYDSQWGPWSLLQQNTTAYKPTAVNLTVGPGTLTPDLYASIQSSDPADYITAVDERIYQDQAGGGTITKWAPGVTSIGGSPTRTDVVYGGSALIYGQQYRRQVIIYNRDGVPSDLTSSTYFTEYAAVGPNVSPGDTLTKQNTLTPTVTLSDPGAANIDQARVEWLNEAGDTTLSDTGIVTFTAAANHAFTAPGGIYNYGDQPQLRAYVRISGNASIGPARTVQIRLNAKPSAPYPVTIEASAGLQVVQRADGVWVTNDSTPDIRAPFHDEDKDLGYTENSVRREVEVKTLAGVQFGASPYVYTTLPVGDVQTAPALTVETEYEVRGRHDDTANVRSDWSDYAFVKYSAAPTIGSMAPTNGATLTDPAPDITGTYGSSGGKSMVAQRLQALQGTTVLFDTGWVPNVQTPGYAIDVHIDPFILPNSASIALVLSVQDSDGLVTTQTNTVTTSFTQPPALATLTVDVDDDNLALLATWAVSGLSDAEFEAYYVYAKPEGGQFALVAEIVDKLTTAFEYLAAEHNAETVIRVTQTNGWAESLPIEASGEVDVDGYWVRTASDLDEVAYVTAHAGAPVLDLETLQPKGRGEELYLLWGDFGYQGKFTIMDPDRTLLDALRGYQLSSAIVMFKFPYGPVRYARITDTPDADGVQDWAQVEVTYKQVLPSSADF